jgi:LPS sulfotransferase NodH
MRSLIPFIVVGMPRTGTTLLLGALQSHAEIRALGELMHASPDERKKPAHAIPRQEGGPLFYDGTGDPLVFLQENAFGTGGRPGVRAAGFKLHGVYARRPGDTPLPERLRDQISDLRVVHITRPDYLAALTSWETAIRTGQWVLKSGPRVEIPPFSIDPSLAVAFFDQQRRCDKMFEQVFRRNPYFHLTYDEITTDFEGTANRVFRFLGVLPAEVQPTLKKQATRPPEETISNFRELAIAIGHTRYAYLVRRRRSILPALIKSLRLYR